jgi:rhodanese-related sulfurtransferase
VREFSLPTSIEESNMEKSFSERVAEARAAVPAVSPNEAATRKAAHPETLFIDPRGADDIRRTTGFIPGALNVPLPDLRNMPDDRLPPELSARTRPIIAACQGGPMGAIAAHTLKQRGYLNVAFIEGGTQAWLDAGYATTR